MGPKSGFYNIMTPLTQMIDDFGDVVTLHSWQAIIARMDFTLSDNDEV